MYNYTLGYSPFTYDPALLKAGSTLTTNPSSGPSAATTLGIGAAVTGVITSALGAYSSISSVKSNLEFQSQIGAINARMAERSAQSILRAAEYETGRVTMKAGQVKSSQKAGQGKRGVAIGVGSAAEEIASTDLIKEMDMNTIYRNATAAAGAARMQSVNFSNASLLQGTMADTLSPSLGAGTTLLKEATSVAYSWYRNKRADALADALGVI